VAEQGYAKDGHGAKKPVAVALRGNGDPDTRVTIPCVARLTLCSTTVVV